jgi:hypothetical protein
MEGPKKEEPHLRIFRKQYIAAFLNFMVWIHCGYLLLGLRGQSHQHACCYHRKVQVDRSVVKFWQAKHWFVFVHALVLACPALDDM